MTASGELANGLARPVPIEAAIDPSLRLTRDRGLFAWVVIAWLLVGVFNTSAAWGIAMSHRMPNVFAYAFGDALAWMLFTWLIFYTMDVTSTRRMPVVLRLAIIGVVIATVAALAITVDITLATPLLYPDARPHEITTLYLRARLHRQIFDAFLIFVIANATRLRSWSTQRELRAAQLETELAKAKTQVLASQMQPHFLFNTLHAISSLAPEEPALAQRMISRLSELLRTSMESASGEVTLAEEIAFAEKYVDIQKMRFGDRLAVRWEVDPHALDLLVPPFLLQPLIENAIKYGISGCEEGGAIDVAARRESGRLHLAVTNDRCEHEVPAETPRNGHGLANLRERLQQTYEEAADVEMQFGVRTVVRLRLPAETRGHDAA